MIKALNLKINDRLKNTKLSLKNKLQKKRNNSSKISQKK